MKRPNHYFHIKCHFTSVRLNLIIFSLGIAENLYFRGILSEKFGRLILITGKYSEGIIFFLVKFL